MTDHVKAYPLSWPLGRPRTPQKDRERGSRFDRQGGKPRTLHQTLSELLEELERYGAIDVVVSTNIPLRQDGVPYSGRKTDDPGVAVYFRRPDLHGHERPYVLATDKYDRIPDNLRSLFIVFESLRRIERHGGDTLGEQAFSGFAALPAATVVPESWWDVLGVDSDVWRGRAGHDVLAHVRHRYRECVKSLAGAFTQHGTGDESESVRRLNEARDTAVKQLEKLGGSPW